MEPIPFTAATESIEGTAYRQTTYEGLVRLEDDALVLEYRERVLEVGPGSGYSETPGDGVREVRIPADAIREVVHRRRWLRPDVLDVELGRLGPAAAVPWVAGTRLRLRVPRRGRDRARELGTDLQMLKADARLRALGEGELAD